MEVLLQEWQEIGVAPFPPRSRFNGQGSKALQEYEKCIKRGVEPGSSLLPCRKQIFDLQRKGIELERRKSILGAFGKESSAVALLCEQAPHQSCHLMLLGYSAWSLVTKWLQLVLATQIGYMLQ